MGTRIRRMLLIPLIIIVSVYVIICAYLYFFQNRLLFYPTHDIALTPDQAGMVFEDQFFELTNGDKIHGWFIPGDSDKPTVLFLHGNGGNVGHRIEHLQFLHSLGVSTLIIDYRGYGRSTGVPTEQHMYDDAEIAYRWLVESKGIPTRRIFLFGESIGGAVAIDLATRVACAGLIIESSFTSLSQIAHHAFPFAPTGLLLRSDFNCIDKLSKISCPILISHSPDDDIIPFQFGERLFEAAKPPKKFVKLSGGHNDRNYLADPAYVEAVSSFLSDPSGAR
jgi:hypothetical protein